MKTGTMFIGGATLVVLVAAVAGVFALGSPSEERALRVDDRRVTDLQRIMTANDLYLTRHAALPASLSELAAEPGVTISVADPATGQPYEYQVVDSVSYELCAVFERDSRDVRRGPEADLFVHGPGRHCFALEAEEIERNER